MPVFERRKKWLFDRAVLQKGDILFSRSQWTGTAIAKATKGRFGHVMVYLGDTVIHADTKGVWSKNPQRILMNEQSRLAAFRLKEPLSPDHLRRVEDFARSRVGSIYSIPQAVSSLRKRPDEIAERFELHTQFCSRLVGQCFAEVGVSLVADFDFCTPNQITESDRLDEVAGCVVQATDDEIEFNKTRDFNQELQREAYRWLSRVRALAEKHRLKPVNAQSDVGPMVSSNPHLDAEVCGYIEATKYLKFFDIDMRTNPWRYDPMQMIQVLRSKTPFATSLEEEHRINDANLRRFEGARLKAIQNANANSGLRYFSLEQQLYTKLVAQMHLWKAALTVVSMANECKSSNSI